MDICHTLHNKTYYVNADTSAIMKGEIFMDVENSFNFCPLNGCGCVGYGYVPYQQLNTVYSPEEGLLNGTLFPELNLTICEYGKVCKGTGGAVNE